MSTIRSEVPEHLVDREYDLTSRHLLVARLVKRICPAGGRVLDIGGSAGLTASFLPGYDVIAADILPDDVDVVASGNRLPFRSDVFSVAVILDVLEHVPAEIRDDIIDEAIRTSGRVIVAGPFADPAVEAAEAHQRAAFEALNGGRLHPWLEEHKDCGLPSLDATVSRLELHGLATARFGSNPLDLWSVLLFNTHVALRMGLDEATHTLRAEMLEDFMEKADATPPSYRHIVVGANASDVDAIVADTETGVDPASVDAAIRATEVNTAKVIDSGLGHIDAYRSRLAEGWQSSVEQAEALQAALDDTDAKWQETIDDYRDLERTHAADVERFEADLATATQGWRNTAERLERVEKSRWSSDTMLTAAPAAWLVNVALPGTAKPPIPPLDGGAFDQWISLSTERVDAPHASGPKVSILVPVFNPPAEFLEACIRSVRSQTYNSWELVLMNASDAPHVDPICSRFAAVDDRIIVVKGANEGIAANTNTAAAAASGEFLALLDHDDELAPHALAAVVAALEEEPDAAVVYSDEDAMDPNGNRLDPFFKPSWSPDLLRHINYITHFMVVRRTLWEEIGGMRSPYDGAQDYDLALRATSRAGGAVHIPDILYHWRRHDASTASDVMVKPYAHFAGRAALEDFMEATAPGARVEFGTGPTSHRVRYPTQHATVTAIVPFKDAAELTEQCLSGLASTKGTTDLEVLLVDNRSEKPETSDRIADWESRWPWVRSVAFDEPFNFQRLNNWAAEQARGSTLLFLNNDTEAVHEGWLDAMLEHAQRPEVGAVGARLFFPDGTVQHAGVTVGIGGFADHPWSGMDPAQWTAAGPSYWTRNFLAVTAACLMIERTKFESVGGFDDRFTIGGGDVDLGVRLHQAGYWNVYTPFARLVHHESASRGTAVPQSDLEQSIRVYAPFMDGGDPFSNPNLSLADTSVSIDATTAAVERRSRIPNRGSR